MSELIDTVVGPAAVLHRLALAVECRDALSDGPVGIPLRVRWRRLPVATNLDPTWRSIPDRGRPHFVLEHRLPDDPDHPLPRLQIVVDDPSRRYVPRRFVVRPWTHSDVVGEPYVRSLARLLRVWLLPGSAYAFPATATVVRGRVARSDGESVRWARVEGTTPVGTAGWGHADDRGEFVLAVTDPGYDPVRDRRPTQGVTLVVTAPSVAPPVDPDDRTVDLVSEVVGRSSTSPTGAQLDNDLLRGRAIPPGYVLNTVPPALVPIEIGHPFHLTADVVFAPPP